RIATLRLDVDLLQLVHQKIVLRGARASGVALALARDAHGRLNVDDLFEGPSHPPPDLEAKIDFDNGFIAYADRGLGAHLVVDKLEGHATYAAGRLAFESRFGLNRGRGRLEGEADLTETPSAISVKTLTIDGAELSADLAPLAPLVPIFGEKPES